MRRAALFVLVAACSRAPAPPPAPPATTLGFGELLVALDGKLAPTPRALELAGSRVKLAGFMVEMEENAPDGAFFLARKPIHGDESGGGTADLPPDVVRVIVQAPGAADRPVEFMAGALEVTGVLEVGRRPEPDGTVSGFRILLDPVPFHGVGMASAAPPEVVP